VRHPIFDAIFDAWWIEHGLDPEWVRAMAEGKIATSRLFAKQALASYGIPIESWPKLGPDYPLTLDINPTTIPQVSAISSPELAQGISRSRSKTHLFVRALYEHPDPAKRSTVKGWAKSHGKKTSTVYAWLLKPGTRGARRIPQEDAELIQEELGVPATLKTWKNGIIARSESAAPKRSGENRKGN
jgi:hypothetical protein